MASRVARRGGSTHYTPPAALGGVTLNLDWDTGDTSQWLGTGHGALEAGLAQNPPGHQSIVQSAVTRTGTGFAIRQEIHNDPGDVNFGYRTLWARYDSQEGNIAIPANHDFVWGFSFNINYIPEYCAIWEMHQRAPIYSITPALSLSPHAIMFRSGELQYRLMAGSGLWDNTNHVWTGMETYEDQKPILSGTTGNAPLVNTWYDLLIHAVCSEGADGVTEVWAKKAGDPWPVPPNYSFYGPNMPWVPGGKDPNVPTAIHAQDSTGGDGSGAGLYLETGFYTGSNTYDQLASPIVIYIDQERRYTDLATAKAGWPSL